MANQGSSFQDKDLPAWDGSWEGFERYSDEVRLYFDGLKWQERDSYPARLLRMFKDTHKTTILNLPLQQRRDMIKNGVDHYLLSIKLLLLEGAVPEAGKYFSSYFQRFKRQKRVHEGVRKPP